MSLGYVIDGQIFNFIHESFTGGMIEQGLNGKRCISPNVFVNINLTHYSYNY